MNEAILTRDLVKRYGRHRALDGFTLGVPAYSITGLVGRNGAGKTTWMMTVAGFVMLGQFRVSDVIPLAVLAKVPPEHYEELWREFVRLPKIAPEELDSLLGLFQMLVDYITARELVALSGDRLFERLDRYLEKHLTEPVTVTAAARAAGQSVSSLSHKLKARYGASFKTILIEKRLRRAEQLLRLHPELSIAEIAAQAGFADHFYFSRLYRKYRGVTPSAYRDGK